MPFPDAKYPFDQRLVQAAPDLLAALKKLVPWKDRGQPKRPPQGWGEWAVAIAAIAKAEGRTDDQ